MYTELIRYQTHRLPTSARTSPISRSCPEPHHSAIATQKSRAGWQAHMVVKIWSKIITSPWTICSSLTHGWVAAIVMQSCMRIFQRTGRGQCALASIVLCLSPAARVHHHRQAPRHRRCRPQARPARVRRLHRARSAGVKNTTPSSPATPAPASSKLTASRSRSSMPGIRVVSLCPVINVIVGINDERESQTNLFCFINWLQLRESMAGLCILRARSAERDVHQCDVHDLVRPVSADTVGHCVQLQQLLYSPERRLVLQDRDRVQRHVPAALLMEPGDWRQLPVAVGWICHLRRSVFVIEDGRQSGLSLLHHQACHSKALVTELLEFIEMS